MKNPARRQSRAFTLVEALVSVSILSILIGILAPALAAARRRAMEIDLLVNQRESMRLLSLYANDHQGTYPFFGLLQRNGAVIRWKGEDLLLQYWNQPEYWGLYLASQGYEQAWITKGPRADPGVFNEDRVDPACEQCGWDPRSWHTLSNTVFASPEFFQTGVLVDEAKTHKPQRQDAVAYPGQKGLLRWRVRQLHRRQPESRAWLTVHFADEHGAIMRLKQLRPGVWDKPDERFWTINATVNGVKGRDM